MLFFAICLTGVPAEAKTVWNSQTIKVKKGGFTFYAKKSRDGHKSWIYRVKTTSKKSVPKALNFPKKIKGAKLTRLGYEQPVYEESGFSKNIFNSYVEEAHNAPGNAPKVKKMTIPDSVTTIEYDAFSGMYALKSVTLPKSLKKLEPSVFFGCEKLKSITLSRKMQSFTPYAFGNCSSLKRVSVPGKNKYYYTRKGMLISKTENKLVWIAPGLTEAVIPDNINTIGEGCLYGSALTDLTIPASVTKIEREALMSSWLTNIDLKDGNPVYGRDGQCIYQKSSGALVACHRQSLRQ